MTQLTVIVKNPQAYTIEIGLLHKYRIVRCSSLNEIFKLHTYIYIYYK